MKRIRSFNIPIAIVISFLFSFASCAREKEKGDSILEKRESILDRVVHIEPDLITEIPKVLRWCDRLKSLKKRRINVGSAELYVEEEGKGMPLILINGGPGGTHHYFHPWFSRAKKYARVIYYDQRGCGLSDFKPGEEGYSVGQAVRDLEEIRKALNINKWIVLGYSYGGFLAQYYTINYPESVAGLMLLGASPGMWVDTGSSRQGEFLSEEERKKRQEILIKLRELDKKKNLSRKEYVQLIVYNNFINGDWKRQSFYKPSPERMAQIALYEWDHDENFNGIMNNSKGRVDLTGAFEKNPIPTLILEGKLDLTWGEKKKDILTGNHPEAQMTIFENASHGIYDEETDKFFNVIKKFIKTLPKVSSESVNSYKDFLVDWKKERKTNVEYGLKVVGWGRNSSKKLSREYSSEWLEQFNETRSFLRVGFALYDFEKYEEALFVFEKMEELAKEEENKNYRALALVWQGHMLDLLKKRREAVKRYQKAVEMNVDYHSKHDQYSLRFNITPYSKDRMKEPFKRVENRTLD